MPAAATPVAVNSFAEELQKIARDKAVKEDKFYRRGILENLEVGSLRQQYLETKAEREAAAPASPSVKTKGYEQWRNPNVHQEGDRRSETELMAAEVAEAKKKLKENRAQIDAIYAKIEESYNIG